MLIRYDQIRSECLPGGQHISGMFKVLRSDPVATKHNFNFVWTSNWLSHGFQFLYNFSFLSFIHLFQHRRSVPVLHPPGEWFGRKHHTKPYTAFYNNNKQYVSLHTWISNKLNKNGNIKKNFSSIFIYSFRFSLIFSCNVVILIIHNAMVEKLSIHTHIIASYGSIQSLNI